MILRLAANAAVHTAGGVVFGLTATLAACTLAQLAREAGRRPDPLSAPRPEMAPSRPPTTGAAL